MTPFEFVGLALLAVLIIATAILSSRTYRGAIYFSLGWIFLILTGIAFAMGAELIAVGLSTLFPLLLVAGTCEWLERAIPGWLIPAATAAAVSKVTLTALGMFMPSSSIETAFEVSCFGYCFMQTYQHSTSRAWITRGLLAGFVALALLEIYDAFQELSGDRFFIDWQLWSLVCVPVGVIQLVAWFEYHRTIVNQDTAISRVARQAAEDRFNALVERSRDIIIEVGPLGQLLYISPNSRKLLGRSPEDLAGLSLPALVQMFSVRPEPDKQIPTLNRPLVEMAREGPFSRIYQIFADTPEARWVEIDASRFLTSEGELRAIAVVRDITERRKFEEQLVSGSKLESLGVLAAGVAHDFNNLLTNILGSAELTRQDIDKGQLDRIPVRLDSLELSVMQAKGLTQQLMTYSGKGSATPQTVRVNEELNKTIELINATVGDEIRFEMKLGESLPPVKVDSVQLSQLVVNLIVNAKDACGTDGRISLSTFRADEVPADANMQQTGPGPFAAIRVTDNGIGMTKEVRSKIFDPFFTTKFDGRGLGLASVFGIIRMHRGAITVESSEGEGATFTIYLPSSDEIPNASAAENYVATGAGSGTILVADDSEVALGFVTEALSTSDFNVLAVDSGEAALEKIRTDDSIRLAFLDLAMPGICGEDLVAEIRKMVSTLPIVIMSGYNETIARERLGNETVQGFMQKPFRIRALLGQVNKLLT